MGRATPASRRHEPASSVAALGLPEHDRSPTVAPQTAPQAASPPAPDIAARLPGDAHNFALIDVFPAPAGAGDEAPRGEASPGDGPAAAPGQEAALAIPGTGHRTAWPVLAGAAADPLPVQRDGETGDGGDPPPLPPSTPPELQLIDPSVIRPALSQISLTGPLTLTPPTVAPPAAAAQAGLPPVPTLTLTPPTVGAPGGGQSPPLFGPGSPPTLTAPGAPVPAGAGPALPRAASAGDMLGAIIAVPAIDTAIKQLQIGAQQQLAADWKRLQTGEKIGVVSALGVIALGSLGGALTDPDARQLFLGQISGKVLPVPGLPWLSAEFTANEDNLGFGLHLDVGQLLPPAWGFGRASIAPLGGPPVQRAADGALAAPERTTAEAIRAAGGGQPLDEATRARLETGLGADLGAVRVHDDAQADGLARGVQARAFASGQDIFFRWGTYAPTTREGLHLVAHEVAHTVQQATGPVAGKPSDGGLTVSDPGDPFERAAEGFAGDVVAATGRDSARPVAPVALPAAPAAQIMRDPAPTGTQVPATTISKVGEAAEKIHDALNPAPGSDFRPAREQILSEILLHQDVAGELKSTYQSTYKRDLLDHVEEVMGSQDALRADEYLNWGRLRAVAKVMLAIDGIGTDKETLWRVLPEAHTEGDPLGNWGKLVARPLDICKTWSSYSFDAALADDLSRNDLDKARALYRYGKLRDIDKIRIGVNQIRTDTALVLEGLREANRSSVRAEYRAEYTDDLDVVLFGKMNDDHEIIEAGALSGEDSAHAQLLLGTASDDPDRLVKLVKVAVDGLGTNTTLIWESVGDAIKRRDTGAPAEKKAAEEQLKRLAAQVADPADPLGLKGLFGDLNDADNARLHAMLGIAVTSTVVPGGSGLTVEILNDPLVQRLRGLGGVDFDSAYETLMKADAATTRAFGEAWKNKESPFHKYLGNNVTINSGQYTGLDTIFDPSVYVRLRFCAGGLRDDHEDYAYNLLRNHTSPEQRLDLRKAQDAIDNGQPSTGEAATAINALHGAFSTAEMGKVRAILQQDEGKPGERDPISATDRAAELEGNVKREGSDSATDDERREMRAKLTKASTDGVLTPEEEAQIRASEDRVAGALKDYVQVRDEYTNYASQAASIAVGLLITAATGGAAGPAVMAAIVRAAVASALARVITEKALRGDRFDLAGADGVRAFINGAVDGAMNVAGAAVAARAMGALTDAAVREALEKGTATLGTRLAASAIEGGIGGGASGTVDAVTNEDTWRGGVANGLTIVFNAGIAAAAQGAVVSVGLTGVHAGLQALSESHPLVKRASNGDDAAIRELMPQLGQRWEVIIADLTNGTGAVATMSATERIALRDALVAHRQRLLGTLDKNFGARPVAGASTEAGSDVDLNVIGETAGQKMLEARRFLDENYPGWQQNYRMALLVDASRVGTVNEFLAALDPAARAQVEARITRTGELYAMTRRVRAAAPEERAALLERVGGDDRARVQQLVDMDDAARRAAHDQALLDGDAAMQRLRGETAPAEKARLAAEVTERQMLANMLNDDAYITPGAVGQFAAGKPVANAAERYQAAVDQVVMIDHQVHENHGVLGAMRSYEIFKYIQRFCDLADGSGLAVGEDAARLTFFRNWAEYLYRVEREATASATAGGPRNLASSADKANVRLADPQAPKPGVSDRFLLENYRDFQGFADRMSGRLRQSGLGDAGPAVGGAPSTGDPAPLVTVPKLTAADEAALAAPESTTVPGAPGVTAAGGVVAGAITPVLNRVNAPIGKAVANEETAYALVTRLTAGDATALHEIGVETPPNYDPRGREWGVGRAADKSIVLIEGNVGGVTWTEFTANGGIPLSHSHPMLPGREMKNPGQTMQQLLPGTERGDLDAIHVLPSVEDFMYCGENNLQMHQVFTPYANLHDGHIGNPAEGLPLISFRIVGIERVGDMGGLPVYRAMLGVADSAGGTFDVTPVWVIGSQHLNGIATSPPAGMVPLASPPTGSTPGGSTPSGGVQGTGGGSGSGQDRNNQDGRP